MKEEIEEKEFTIFRPEIKSQKEEEKFKMLPIPNSNIPNFSSLENNYQKLKIELDKILNEKFQPVFEELDKLIINQDNLLRVINSYNKYCNDYAENLLHQINNLSREVCHFEKELRLVKFDIQDLKNG